MTITTETTFIATLCVFFISCLYLYFRLRGKEQRKNNYYSSHLPAPYTCFSHPDKCFTDKVLGLLFPKISSLASLANFTCRDCDEEYKHDNDSLKDVGNSQTRMRKYLKEFRSKMFDLDRYAYVSECKAWNKLLHNDYLVGGTVLVERDSTILSRWDIVEYKEDVKKRSESQRDECIEVEIICPSSIITSEYHIHDDKTEKHGYKVISTCKFEDLTLSSKADIFIYFHGGGMTLGQSKDGAGLGSITNLLKSRTQNQEECPPIILLSVNYRLSPDFPFPAAVVDGLCVSSSVIEHCPKSRVHFVGISAGGNLCSVIGFESYRRYSDGKIKSLVAIDPMLLPETKTMSYHLNSLHSPFCPVEFLRWCWGCYLSFDSEDINFHSLESYSKALHECKWFVNSKDETISDSDKFRRLITPQIDLPPNINGENAPVIIVTTSKADPLRDDGIDLLQTLKKKGGSGGAKSTNILHFDKRGSHVISLLFDKKGKERFFKAWNNAIWG